MSRRHMNFAIPHRTSSVAQTPNNVSQSRRASHGVLPSAGNTVFESDATLSSSGAEWTDRSIQSNVYNGTTDRARKPVLDRISELNPRRDPDTYSSEHIQTGADSRSAQPQKQQSNQSLQELRQRASSPLLGQSYKRNIAPYSPFNSKQRPLRPSDSSSTLHSSYEPFKTTSAESNNTSSSRDLALRRGVSNSSRQSNLTDTRSSTRQPTKQKHRPPMIDLSKLFPKPQKSDSPLLSPNRMMASPSPVSIRSDASVYRSQKHEKISSTGNKLMKAPKLSKSDAMRQQYPRHGQIQEARHNIEAHSRHGHLKHQQSLPAMHKYSSHGTRRDSSADRRKGPSHWFDGPEGQISDDDIIPEEWEEQTGGRQSTRLPPASPSYFYGKDKRGSVASTVPSMAQSATSKRSSRTIQLPPINTYLRRSPSTQANAEYTRYVPSVEPSTSVDSRWAGRSERLTKTTGPTSGKLTRKSSRTVLDAADLNESSVLCLSSSEDESDTQNLKAAKPDRRTKISPSRDSIATLDDYSSAEIGVAQAVTPARRPSLQRIRSGDRAQSKPTTIAEEPTPGYGYLTSPSSSIKSPSLYSDLPSQIINTIPKIPTSAKSQTSSHDSGSQKSGLKPQAAYQISATADRRSRFMAVTRQEEHLLEMMRREKGATPGNSDSEPPKSRTAALGMDFQPRQNNAARNGLETSFLALSPGLPSPHPGFHGIPSERDFATGGVSDGDTGTDHSTSSLGVGLTDTFPSPSTGRASPRTPTLQTKYTLYPRNSMVPSIPPSNEEKRHSRTRTDSSSAVVFGNSDDNKSGIEPDEDLPIWATGWNHEAPGMAVIH